MLDPVIHSQGRLIILATLTALPPDSTITFPRLQEVTKMTPGNLTTHLGKLEERGYVQVEKTFVLKKPQTSVSVTLAGRSAFAEYRSQLKQLLG